MLAKSTRNIDLIIRRAYAHFYERPGGCQNLDGKITTINQVGWAGINLGRVDYYFDHKRNKKNQPVLLTSYLIIWIEQ